MNCTYIDCIMYFQDDFDNHSLRFESNMTPAQLCMYGVIQYHFNQMYPKEKYYPMELIIMALHLANYTCSITHVW